MVIVSNAYSISTSTNMSVDRWSSSATLDKLSASVFYTPGRCYATTVHPISAMTDWNSANF